VQGWSRVGAWLAHGSNLYLFILPVIGIGDVVNRTFEVTWWNMVRSVIGRPGGFALLMRS